MQNYLKPVSGFTAFGALYVLLGNTLDTLLSQSSGTAFPASPLTGQACYRTDRLTSSGYPKCYKYSGNPALGESGWVEDAVATVLGEEIANARGTKPTLDQRLDVALNEDGTLKASTSLNPSQWYLPSLTFTYVSTTSFTANGDQTDIYQKNRRLKINLSASVVYSEVVSATYSSPNTTVQVLDAVLDNTLVSVEHSLFLPGTQASDGGKSAISPRMLGQSAIEYAADSGAANAYVVTLNPAPTAYFNGMKVVFKATNANTTVSTINVNGLGVKTIKKNGNVDISAGEILAGQIVELSYDGTNFQLTSRVNTSSVSAANMVPVTDSLNTLKAFSLKDHGSKSSSYGLDLSLADIHLVEFTATATLTISATNTKEKALVIVKNNDYTITLAGIDNGSPTLTKAVSTQDFLALIKSFGKITCVAAELNYTTV